MQIRLVHKMQDDKMVQLLKNLDWVTAISYTVVNIPK